nr:RHS repeat-associated core domain-containing protein [Flavobacterium columnare]
MTDEKGKLVEERHFDAWGNLTHGSMQVLDRGYTSHEHLQDVGLIHMNGRLYDPMLRRFLNADENIQDPTNTQCYNKYGYVMNNPLMFNDPDGEYAVGVAIAVAALVAVLSYTVTIYARDGSLRHWKLGDAYVSAIYGAFGSLGASAFGAIGGDFAKSTVGTITFGAISGGVGAELSGGNFWQGVVIGGMVAGLNHTMHNALDEGSEGEGPKPKKVQNSESNLKSNSAVIGYEGTILSKAEIAVKFSSKGAKFSDLRHISKSLKGTSIIGKGLGVVGLGFTVYEDFTSGGITWGTAAKVGIGGALLFASAPFAIGYTILDVGWGLATKTTITDNIGNLVNKKNN